MAAARRRPPPHVARGARPRAAVICAASHARNIAQSCAHPAACVGLPSCIQQRNNLRGVAAVRPEI
ncbi:hypothetical protein F511_47321 [Dorcoceras hygrometricum]|uniref:Uncharacterized protein n=1 Tax=Dorcoceras hygrometricum TaxID=472368 RepID=A0A2Z6ZRB2_9LAMI|nr:hypothetical protein F511_47321 [Dorcoceras hygrometricum]